MTPALEVVAPGPLCTVQDEGRPGQGALGIGRSGACDRASYRRANRLVGNEPGAAALEVTLGGLVLRALAAVTVVTTGARCADDPAHDAPVALRPGEVLRLGAPAAACAPTSRSAAGSTSSRSWARGPPTCWAVSGPRSLAAGDLLPVGATTHPMPGVDHAPVPEPPAGEVSGAGAARTAPRLVRRRRLGLAHRPGVGGDRAEQPGRRPARRRPAAARRATASCPARAWSAARCRCRRPACRCCSWPTTRSPAATRSSATWSDDDVDACGQLRPGQRLRLREARLRRRRPPAVSTRTRPRTVPDAHDGPMTDRPVLRTLLVVVLAALASAATWWAWLGWESGYVTDPATGAVTGPYSVAQVAACVLTLVVVALVAGWFAAPWWVAPAITVAFVGPGRPTPPARTTAACSSSGPVCCWWGSSSAPAWSARSRGSWPGTAGTVVSSPRPEPGRPKGPTPVRGRTLRPCSVARRTYFLADS